MKLPDPCELCTPLSGNWIETETGLARCRCDRGRMLVARNKPEYRPRIIPETTATICMESMSGIPFFPSDAGARADIADEIACLCETTEQAKWLAKRMTRLYLRWPGTPEMRLVFCSKHTPLDGIPSLGMSQHYPDGIPSEQEHRQLAIAPPIARRATVAEDISAAPSLSAFVGQVAATKDLKRLLDGIPSEKPSELPVIRITDANRITAEAVEKAKQEHRDHKAHVEFKGDE